MLICKHVKALLLMLLYGVEGFSFIISNGFNGCQIQEYIMVETNQEQNNIK